MEKPRKNAEHFWHVRLRRKPGPEREREREQSVSLWAFTVSAHSLCVVCSILPLWKVWHSLVYGLWCVHEYYFRTCQRILLIAWLEEWKSPVRSNSTSKHKGRKTKSWMKLLKAQNKEDQAGVQGSTRPRWRAREKPPLPAESWIQNKDFLIWWFSKSGFPPWGGKASPMQNADLQFLPWFDGLDDGEEDALAMLVGNDILLSKRGCRTHEHHPVTLVLVLHLKVASCAICLLQLYTIST